MKVFAIIYSPSWKPVQVRTQTTEVNVEHISQAIFPHIKLNKSCIQVYKWYDPFISAFIMVFRAWRLMVSIYFHCMEKSSSDNLLWKCTVLSWIFKKSNSQIKLRMKWKLQNKNILISIYSGFNSIIFCEFSKAVLLTLHKLPFIFSFNLFLLWDQIWQDANLPFDVLFQKLDWRSVSIGRHSHN